LSGERFADPGRSARHHGPGSEAGDKIVHAILLWEFWWSLPEALAEGDQEPRPEEAP
jgi:hypothetical protein